MHPHRSAQKPPVAIVGGESLLGKEVRELLDESDLRARIRMINSAPASEDTAILTRLGDEPGVVSSFETAGLADAQVVFLAGTTESSRRSLESLGSGGVAAIIDLSGALEDQPSARLRAPILEAGEFESTSDIQVIAHPAAIALALFLAAIRNAAGIVRSVAQIFEPVSERGQAGIEELQKQTVGLLSFKALPQEVFDTQVAFNMLVQYGPESQHSLEETELKIERHLASLLAGSNGVPMPSLRLVQAPVFHGYSISVWVEFDKATSYEALAGSLASPHIDVRTQDLTPPTNVGVAGQTGITVGAVSEDRNHPHTAFWFWIAADNLRLAAENAVEVARAYLK